MKTGVQALVYNQEEYLEYYLNSIYPRVDFIQIMFAEKPFNQYNESARESFSRLDSSLEIIKRYSDPERKISLSSGVWDREEDMRNDALALMQENQVELCLIIDVDEFWPDMMLKKLIHYLIKNLDKGDVAWCRDKTLFKRFDRLIDFPQSKLPVAFRLTKESKFLSGRVPFGNKFKLPEIFNFWHLGYVLSDQRMYEKIHTFSHAHEVPSDWFAEKWMKFTPETKNLCRKDPKRWKGTIKNNPCDLPKLLHDHPFFFIR